MDLKTLIGEALGQGLETSQKSGGKLLPFGLNVGTFSDVEFKADPKFGEQVSATFTKEGRKAFFRVRFPKWGDELYFYGDKISEGHEDYKTAFTKDINSAFTTLIHFIGMYVGEELLMSNIEKFKAAVSFENMYEIMTSYLPQNYSEIKVDVFLQFSKGLRKDNKIKFVEFPSGNWSGMFLSKHIEGNFEEQRGESGIRYFDKETENYHPFMRDGKFMNGPYANQVEKDDTSNPLTEGINPLFSDLPAGTDPLFG